MLYLNSMQMVTSKKIFKIMSEWDTGDNSKHIYVE